jgi:hypothetical protein
MTYAQRNWLNNLAARLDRALLWLITWRARP